MAGDSQQLRIVCVQPTQPPGLAVVSGMGRDAEKLIFWGWKEQSCWGRLCTMAALGPRLALPSPRRECVSPGQRSCFACSLMVLGSRRGYVPRESLLPGVCQACQLGMAEGNRGDVE